MLTIVLFICITTLNLVSSTSVFKKKIFLEEISEKMLTSGYVKTISRLSIGPFFYFLYFYVHSCREKQSRWAGDPYTHIGISSRDKPIPWHCIPVQTSWMVFGNEANSVQSHFLGPNLIPSWGGEGSPHQQECLWAPTGSPMTPLNSHTTHLKTASPPPHRGASVLQGGVQSVC